MSGKGKQIAERCWRIFLYTCVGVMMLWAVVGGLTILRMYFDDTAYHIPISVAIAKSLNPYVITQPLASSYFPALAETISALFILVFGSIYVTNITGALAFIGLFFVGKRFAGHFTDDPDTRLLGGCTAMSTPLLLAQCQAFYIDIHFVFFFILTLHFVAQGILQQSGRHGWFALASAFCLAGLKFSGLYYCLFLVPIIAYIIWRHPWRMRWWSWLTVLAVVALNSGWYVRNLILKGNPIYPFPMPGPVEWLFTRLGIPWQSHADSVLNAPRATWPHPLIPKTWPGLHFFPDMPDDGFGIVLLLGLAAWLGCMLLIRKVDRSRARLFLLFSGLAMAIVLCFPTLSWLDVPRYALFMPVLLVLMALPMLLDILRKHAPFMRLAIMGLVAVHLVTYLGANAFMGQGSLPELLPRLHPYQPIQRVAPQAQAGGLRVGYLGGFNEFVAALYDPGLTNTLVPLHYKNYLWHYAEEFDTPEAFMEHVRGLDLDLIVVFDESRPGADMLRQLQQEMAGQ